MSLSVYDRVYIDIPIIFEWFSYKIFRCIDISLSKCLMCLSKYRLIVTTWIARLKGKEKSTESGSLAYFFTFFWFWCFLWSREKLCDELRIIDYIANKSPYRHICSRYDCHIRISRTIPSLEPCSYGGIRDFLDLWIWFENRKNCFKILCRLPCSIGIGLYCSKSFLWVISHILELTHHFCSIIKLSRRNFISELRKIRKCLYSISLHLLFWWYRRGSFTMSSKKESRIFSKFPEERMRHKEKIINTSEILAL